MDITAYQHMRISTRGKRPLRNLTPGDKVRAIQRIHNGETKASVSRDIGVPESTLRGWCKNEQKLRFMCRQLGGAISDPGIPMDNPPEKRSKMAEAFDYNASFGFDPVGSMCSGSRLNGTSLSIDRKTNGFNANNIADGLMKTNGAPKDETNQLFSDSAFLPGMNVLSSTATNLSQLPLIQNINLLSFLNPSLTVPGVNRTAKFDCLSNKSSTPETVNSKDVVTKVKTQLSPVSVKPWAHEALCSPQKYSEGHPKNNIVNTNNTNDTNDSNNNDVSAPMHPKKEYNDIATLFSNGIPFPPLPPIPPMLSADARSDAILQWSKVFNASLSFLALATAAAAIQSPASVSPFSPSATDNRNVGTPKSSPVLQKLQQNGSSSYSPQLFEHSEESCFESEPEDLSVRSGTSKVSSSGNSRPQSPAKDVMSDLTVSDEDEEH